MDPRTPELRRAYSRFLAEEGRILLSGHSHQAWPDVAREAQLAVFDDAAERCDDKWERIFAIADEVGRAILGRMGFAADDPIAFGESTHQLVYRLLSALDLGRARVVTSTSEFHSLHRQLSRLAEDGLEVIWVPGQPRATLGERLAEAITPGTTLCAVSAVLFEDAYIVDDLAGVIARAHEVGAIPLVDAYHAFNVVPVTWGEAGRHAYVCAGGYKYAGFGNGLCWLRFPPASELRPRYTGWFADFAHLSAPRTSGAPVAYGPGGARFAGATFDASALYRAAATLRHWDRFGLDVAALRAISTAQTRRIIERLAGRLPLVSSPDDARRGGFVSVRHARAEEITRELRRRRVFVDSRGELLRIGPAPYLLDEEIDRGVDVITQTSDMVDGCPAS
jgi:selenocysteine lyase/cysteine desulfurase